MKSNQRGVRSGESTGTVESTVLESTERVRSLQRTGLALGRGGLNFGAAENNFKTKPARARLWDSTVVFHSSDEEWKRWKAQLSSAHLRIGRSKEEPDR